MSDSIDRVFVKAISTIRALSSRSNYGSLPRPPAENRIKLYGLYKQATEGDVDGVMPRPVGFTPEDEGAKKKWDAWKNEQGLSKTEAKRQYISFLIETMKVYASGTLEARELLSELEYLWDQIKDLQFSSDDEDRDIPLPSHSPSFSHIQSDRYSNATPSISNQQYRSNLERIYSHSRRNTSLSINEYVQQQRSQHLPHQSVSQIPATTSVYSLPLAEQPKPNARSVYSLRGNSRNIDASALEDFRSWQGEINLIINKLSTEILRSRRKRNDDDSENTSEHELDPKTKLKLRVLLVARFLGRNLLKWLKNFSASVVAILFIVWCFKRNVIVQRAIVKQPVGNSTKEKKELVINMILNTRDNKWFIQLLDFVNKVVGFV